MAYKLGLILSMLFIAMLFVFAGDLTSIQIIYTNLDAVSVVAGNLISSRGGLDDEIVNLVYEQSGGNIEAIGDETPMLGSIYEYKISREYTPWVMSNKPMEISVTSGQDKKFEPAIPNENETAK